MVKAASGSCNEANLLHISIPPLTRFVNPSPYQYRYRFNGLWRRSQLIFCSNQVAPDLPGSQAVSQAASEVASQAI